MTFELNTHRENIHQDINIFHDKTLTLNPIKMLQKAKETWEAHSTSPRPLSGVVADTITMLSTWCFASRHFGASFCSIQLYLPVHSNSKYLTCLTDINPKGAVQQNMLCYWVAALRYGTIILHYSFKYTQQATKPYKTAQV